MSTPAPDVDAHGTLGSALNLRRKEETYGQAIWRRFRRHKLAVVGLVVLAILMLLSIFAGQIAPYDPNQPFAGPAFTPPGPGHWLGTDNFGRDELSRALFAGRISLSVGVVAAVVSVSLGIIIGAIAGYSGGMIDNTLMRVTDVFISFPTLFLLVTLVAVLGGNIYVIIGALSFTGWTGTARLIRGQFLSLRQQDFVEGARAVGANNRRIIFMHILPHALPPVIVTGTLFVGGAILAEAALSYIGLGIQPPTASWGNMMNQGQGYMRQAWWMTIDPGIFIFLTLISINLIGDALRDALDPHQDTA